MPNFTKLLLANRKIFMVILKILAITGLIGSTIWFIAQPGYEPALAIITFLSALIAAFYKQRHSTNGKQQQSISDSSIGVQAGGNITIGDTKGGKNVK